MKSRIVLVVFFMLIPLNAIAELPKEKMKKDVVMMEDKLKLSPFIKKIQDGTVSADHKDG